MRVMTRAGRIGCGLVAGLLVAAGARPVGAVTLAELDALPGQNRMVRVLAPRVRTPPVIDGTLDLDRGEWADAPAVPGMLMPNGGRLVPMAALTFLAWDEANFYLGMRTEIKPGYVLRRRGREMDGEVNRDDVVELVFNPLGRDQPEAALFQLMFNALGFRWDAMVTVGVTAKYWNADGWEFRSDYKPGMDHWDLEIRIPVASMRMKRPNRPGDCWLVLATRDWKNLVDDTGKPLWNLYSSLTGNGGFISQENQFPFVLDDTAPVVQLLDLAGLRDGRFGFRARFANTTDQPQSFSALASVYDNTGYQGRDQDWSLRANPLATQSREFSLKPGEAAEWDLPAADLPALAADPARKLAPLYGFVFKVVRAGGAGALYLRQCEFRQAAFTCRPSEAGYPMDIAYNPERGTVMPTCDIIDAPDKARILGLDVEILPAGGERGAAPLLTRRVTRVSRSIVSELLPLPDLTPGSYPVRMALVDVDGKPLATNETAIVKLDEPAVFPWWDSRAGISDSPAPPHRPLRVEGRTVATATGVTTFDGSALPAQMRMTGLDLLAAPVRLTAGAGGKPAVFTADPAPAIGRTSAVEVSLAGGLSSDVLRVSVSNHMEYDGAQWIALDIEPAAREVVLDYLRLEIPFKPERAQWLFTMAMSGRESWVAEDLTRGEGRVWDSSLCRGLGMTVGTFVPQYLVSDSLRGLCWYANNDKGWVPTDDVPATEVVRQAGETVLRFNLIGKPFAVKGPRRILFGLLGMPARPMPPGSRIVERQTSQFGHYVGDKVVNYSSPMPRDFAKAKAFMEKGTLYDAKTYEPLPAGRAKEWLREFAPWHDSHTPWRTPDLDPRTYDYMAREFEGYGFVPRLVNLRAWQWERYVQAAPIDGLYYDTPEGMGYSRSIQNEVAYLIPDDQPRGGEVQGGYNLTGFREEIKRVYAICIENGIDNPWIEMHSTHGCVVPASGFLTMRIDGEDFRRPSYRNFMAAWPIRHLRAIDVPALYGSTTRWLGGYPWDGLARDVDPLRCQMAALFVHDVWTPGFGDWSATTIGGKGVLVQTCDREPPYGFANPDMPSKLIGLGLNLAEAQFLPYWDNAGVLTLARRDGQPADEIRASAWLVPSQKRLIVAVANWNEATVPCRLKLVPGGTGWGGAAIQIADLEGDQVLARGAGADAIEFDISPLDFRLFMATAIPGQAGTLAPAAGGAGYAWRHDGAPESALLVTNAALAEKLLALGINGPDVVAVPTSDPAVAFAGNSACTASAWHIPSQRRLIVAVLNHGSTRTGGRLKVDLAKLGLLPAEPGDSVIFSDLGTDRVLLRTTGMNRGMLLGLWKGLKDAEGRKLASPADEASVSIPPGDVGVYMVTLQ